MIKGPPMLEACTKNWSSVYKKRRFSLSFYIAFDTAYFGEITYSWFFASYEPLCGLKKRRPKQKSRVSGDW